MRGCRSSDSTFEDFFLPANSCRAFLVSAAHLIETLATELPVAARPCVASVVAAIVMVAEAVYDDDVSTRTVREMYQVLADGAWMLSTHTFIMTTSTFVNARYVSKRKVVFFNMVAYIEFAHRYTFPFGDSVTDETETTDSSSDEDDMADFIIPDSDESSDDERSRKRVCF